MSQTHKLHSPEQALERLAGLPGGPELLAAARERTDVALVGGAVRDLLLGRWPRELDVTVERDSAGLAAELAARVSPSERAYGHSVEPMLHERFGTASVVWEYGRIDVAERRAEVYPYPGALPEVRPGGIEEDLARRDFTVNALALPLGDSGDSALRSFDGALEDLAAGELRVLHARSFIEDPTRILRMARYSARLGFEIEPRTRVLAEDAVAGGALRTVSGERIGNELWLAAAEADGRASLRALDSLGVLAGLGMPSPVDDDLAQRAAELLPRDGRRDVLLMGVALRRPAMGEESWGTPSALEEAMTALAFTKERARAVAGVASAANGLSELLATADRAAAQKALQEHSLEAAATAGALAGRESGATPELVREWIETDRHVHLEIDGNDLLAAGVPQGPEIRARLDRALDRKRAGLAEGREEELRVALEDGETTEPAR